MKRLCWLTLVCLLSLTGANSFGQGVQVKVVKYGGLKDVVIKNRGKVILVDFWGDFCPACKQGMPHVVQLHKAYAKNGLVVVSVSVDDIHHGNPDILRGRVQGFLQGQGATFTNLILDEQSRIWQEKLRIETVPCYYVFNRQGKWTQFGGNSSIDYAVMDRLILDLLREK